MPQSLTNASDLFRQTAADPNLVKTPKENKRRQAKEVDMEAVAFQMMIKQSLHQNPLSPKDPSDFAEASFRMAAAESNKKLVSGMDKILEKLDQMMGVQANSFRGQEVIAKGNQFTLKNAPTLNYEVPEGTKMAMVHVMNDQKEIVKSYIAETSPGKHSIDFDGTGTHGQKLPEGTYNYILQTENNDGLGLSQKLGRVDLKDRTQNLLYQLPQNADKGTLVVSNEQGRVVGAVHLTGKDMLSRGEHTVPFDGNDPKGIALPPGQYTFKVKAWDSEGQDITTETLVSGKVEWGEMKDKVPMLNLGNGMSVPLSDYRSTRGIEIAKDVLNNI